MIHSVAWVLDGKATFEEGRSGYHTGYQVWGPFYQPGTVPSASFTVQDWLQACRDGPP